MYDLLIIGGGINGTSIARDTSGRGLRILLCEMGDLACATSSASSKLLHGGLRYLEQCEFRLVHEALVERETLLRTAPHLCRTLRFQLPYHPGRRPAWLIRTGLLLYDYLNFYSKLPRSCTVKPDTESPLHKNFTQSFEYSDGWVDDARLVILNAMDAHQHGATILPRTRCSRAWRSNGYWQVELENRQSGQRRTVKSRMLVNAAGPWVDRIAVPVQQNHPQPMRLVRGSHIVVPRFFNDQHAWLLQHDDQRIVFVIPWEQKFTLIGTTDIDEPGDPGQAHISEEETKYLLQVCRDYFHNAPGPEDILYSFSGVRPLPATSTSQHARTLSRDYQLILEQPPKQGIQQYAPLLSVRGGKLTTSRALAEQASNKICQVLQHSADNWTASSPLPGGDFSTLTELQSQLASQYSWLADTVLTRYVRSYGTLCTNFLQGCTSIESLGEHFGAGLYAREIQYLQQQEWAVSLEDILWRRSKLGLHLSVIQQQHLRAWLSKQKIDLIAELWQR